ncbi:hypothetical protein SC499_02670 [Peribacillus simplex]|nr:hypothetical protein [Peribacillus simplex]MDW7613654.1 hypothetical protein [Peribacillus simplex]
MEIEKLLGNRIIDHQELIHNLSGVSLLDTMVAHQIFQLISTLPVGH